MAQVVLRPNAVAAAIDSLLTGRVHPTFVGYLCIKREAARRGRNDNLQPDFWEFHETFLRVAGGPPRKPYCRPFWDELAATKDRVWYQKNVAGTYAPSSAERIPRFMQVIDINRGRYALRQRHWEKAREWLAYKKQIPAIPLAVFLYRDFAFEFPVEPSLATLLVVFRDEFGYPIGEADAEFDHLYSLDTITGVNEYFDPL